MEPQRSNNPFEGEELANPLYGVSAQNSQASLTGINANVVNNEAVRAPSRLQPLQSAPIPQNRQTPLRDSASQRGMGLGRMLTTGTFKKNASELPRINSVTGTKVAALQIIYEDPKSTPEARSLAKKLIDADVDRSGIVSTVEMFDCLCGVVNEVRMNVSDLQRLAGQRSDKYSDIIAKKLSELDGDGDGGIDSNELVNGIVELIDAEKERDRSERESKMWRWFAFAAGLLCFMTVAVIIALSVALQEAYKDSKVSSSSVLLGYRGDALNQPIQTASTDFSIDSGSLVTRTTGGTVQVATTLSSTSQCPIYLPLEYMKNLQLVEFQVDPVQNTTIYLKPLGFLMNSKAITFYTNLGDLTFSNFCSSISGEVVDKLIAQGIMKGPTNGRKMLQMPPFGTSSGGSKSGGNLGR